MQSADVFVVVVEVEMELVGGLLIAADGGHAGHSSRSDACGWW